jgi:hypothetical protein
MVSFLITISLLLFVIPTVVISAEGVNTASTIGLPADQVHTTVDIA